jgi:hypothetical protein
MRLSTALGIGLLAAAIGLCIEGQNPPGKATPFEGKGMPPRATPADYQSHAQAGTVTVAAEFEGHSMATFEGNLSTEEYVVVEAGLFGPQGARLKLSSGDFTLRLNGKKTPLPSQPYGLVVKAVKDPEWAPPEPPVDKKSKTGVDTGGGGQQGDPKPSPTPVKIPIELQRAWAQRVQRATLPEGDRALPQAGLLFFEYRGKTEKSQCRMPKTCALTSVNSRRSTRAESRAARASAP